MSKPRIIEEKALELEGHDLHEFLRRDIERWIAENRAAHEDRVSKESLYAHLAEQVEVTPRQLKRYMEGATEISVKKAVSICREIGLAGIFEYANYELGLDTCEMPSLPAGLFLFTPTFLSARMIRKRTILSHICR